MLRYPKGAPPNVLTGWQATPGADWDSLPAADKDKVRDALLRDQGSLCAYCERRIHAKDRRMKVEHWQAQAGGGGPLRWSNLLGVCLGDERAETGAPAGEQHCDTARGNAPLFLHPVENQGPSPRDHLRYTTEGEVRPSQEGLAESVKRDIDALNLNAARLRRARTVVYEVLKERLDKLGWTRQALQEEYRAAALLPGVKTVEHCEVVRYYLRRWAQAQGLRLKP
jgi:uncharacterized protein (TIGR02646 family)